MLGNLIILFIVMNIVCNLLLIAGIIVKILEIWERKEIKRIYRKNLKQNFKEQMKEIGKSAEECYEVIENERM